LDRGLRKLGYITSFFGPCVYYHDTSVLILYVDNGAIFGIPNKEKIDGLIKGLKREFNITNEGGLKEHLGVLVENEPNQRMKLLQPHLISQILDKLWFNHKTNTKAMLVLVPGEQLLQWKVDSESMKEDFHYRSVIWKENFLEKFTRPILMWMCINV
jgi:hypothetical protein